MLSVCLFDVLLSVCVCKRASVGGYVCVRKKERKREREREREREGMRTSECAWSAVHVGALLTASV